jgi:hypothetical protein
MAPAVIIVDDIHLQHNNHTKYVNGDAIPAGVMKTLLKWASLNIGNQQFIYNLLSFVFIL